MITVFYSSIDGYREKRSFKTLAGARKYAQYRVGKTPEIGSYYAVSGDGVGKVTVDGAPFTHLFGDNEPDPYDQLDAAYKAEKAALDAAYAKAVASGSEADNEFYQALKAEFDWTYKPSRGMKD